MACHPCCQLKCGWLKLASPLECEDSNLIPVGWAFQCCGWEVPSIFRFPSTSLQLAGTILGIRPTQKKTQTYLKTPHPEIDETLPPTRLLAEEKPGDSFEHWNPEASKLHDVFGVPAISAGCFVKVEMAMICT